MLDVIKDRFQSCRKIFLDLKDSKYSDSKIIFEDKRCPYCNDSFDETRTNEYRCDVCEYDLIYRLDGKGICSINYKNFSVEYEPNHNDNDKPHIYFYINSSLTRTKVAKIDLIGEQSTNIELSEVLNYLLLCGILYSRKC